MKKSKKQPALLTLIALTAGNLYVGKGSRASLREQRCGRASLPLDLGLGHAPRGLAGTRQNVLCISTACSSINRPHISVSGSQELPSLGKTKAIPREIGKQTKDTLGAGLFLSCPCVPRALRLLRIASGTLEHVASISLQDVALSAPSLAFRGRSGKVKETFPTLSS